MCIQLLFIATSTFCTLPALAMLARPVVSYASTGHALHIPCKTRNLYVPSSISKNLPSLRTKRLSFTTLISRNAQLQNIDKMLREAQMKKLMANSRFIAWNASAVLLIPSILIPTLAVGGLFGAASILCALVTPVWLLNGDFSCLKETACAYTGLLGSCGALTAELKLADFIAKKCDHNDKDAIVAQELIESLRKKQKEIRK